MRMYDIIYKKRGGGELSREEIEHFVKGYTAGEIPDYQASALLMAIFLNGMTSRETADLTLSMAHSGDVLDLSIFGGTTADKHSTGGVGDKTTLIVAPIAACTGCRTAKMSGRGLGFTGGTIDKLESIPGFNTRLHFEDFINQIKKIGVALTEQSGNLTPADKKIYALRDVTATVESLPLIAASVMSKKIASGADVIVLDVKCGSGAFMKTQEEAEELARMMVKIGASCGRKTAALITNMDAPLGSAVGNSLEVAEAARFLKNGEQGELREICLALAANMASLALNIPLNKAREEAERALDSGDAYKKILEWVAAQGGDTRYIENPDLFEKAAYIKEVKSTAGGYITKIDTEAIGGVAGILGVGRTVKGEAVDAAAGIEIIKTVGDFVNKGDVLCLMHTNKPSALEEAEKRYTAAITFGEKAPPKTPIIYKTMV